MNCELLEKWTRSRDWPGLAYMLNPYPSVGLAGRADHEIWQYALDRDFTVVTTNARDFIELLDVDVHPGLIVLRESGLSRDETVEAHPACSRVCEEFGR